MTVNLFWTWELPIYLNFVLVVYGLSFPASARWLGSVKAIMVIGSKMVFLLS